MTDRELLEMAAKAARMEQHGHMPSHWLSLDRGIYECWNPLTDDGDALRLAVKLRLVVDADQGEVLCPHEPARGVHYAGPTNAESIRRAIVRAAAAIGEKQ